MFLIAYDINTETPEGKTRLRRVARTCEAYGKRVQNSLFECHVDISQFETLKGLLEDMIDMESDSIRYYRLGENAESRVMRSGSQKSEKMSSLLIA